MATHISFDQAIDIARDEFHPKHALKSLNILPDFDSAVRFKSSPATV
jgi:hypothetical protein